MGTAENDEEGGILKFSVNGNFLFYLESIAMAYISETIFFITLN